MLTAEQEHIRNAERTQGRAAPAHVIGAAVKVMKIATGEIPEDYGSDPESGGKDWPLWRSAGRASKRVGWVELLRNPSVQADGDGFRGDIGHSSDFATQPILPNRTFSRNPHYALR
jgi:hypothetical protein